MHKAIKLYDFHTWANQKFFQHLKELPESVIHGEVKSVFSSLHEGLVHILMIDQVWLYAIQGKSFEEIRTASGQLAGEAKGKGLDELERLYHSVKEKYLAYFDQQADLDAHTSVSHPVYGTLQASYADLIQHVVNHGTYHRGNLTAMLRQMGHTGVPTDYIFYLYESSR
ncbi:DinB family protein [Brevibacillus migulae]|uniref:DinB family protein n=1 Tax=Brevibacillus migulae TaxID=1644114 RepID=UPI001F1FD472|nr:DinB family protein [Brevibacillus migulae]